MKIHIEQENGGGIDDGKNHIARSLLTPSSGKYYVIQINKIKI